MRELNLDNYKRMKTYEWFKSFSNATYGMNVRMDVTKLVEYTKENNQSFFINMLYIVVNALNSVPEMRMRLVDDKPVIFDDVSPAFTVMTNAGTFENVRHSNYQDYNKFYEVAAGHIEAAKLQSEIIKNDYNPENCYDEYYITCVPWCDYLDMSHPIPDDISNQCVPRICWGKYVLNNDKYELTLNITVSHIFVDGYQLCSAFNKIQDMLNDVEDVLK